jgi:signal transduction histidine kinase
MSIDQWLPRQSMLCWLVGICVSVCLANLVGWFAGVRILISLGHGLPAMVPATTLLALTTAGALWVCQRRPASYVATICPLIVIGLSLCIEVAYIVGDAPAPFLLAESGRESVYSLSSPITAGMFTALGSAVLFLSMRSKLQVAQAVAVATLLFALLTLSAYLFRDTLLFAYLPGQGTSVLTVAALMLLSMGVLAARPHEGLMAAVTGYNKTSRISRRLLLSALYVPIAAATAAVLAARAGWYDLGTTLPLFVWLLVVLLIIVTWRNALQLDATETARQLATDDLHRALAELRSERDRKDKFLATLAHELRNPLAPIQSCAEILRRGGAGKSEERTRLGAMLATQVGHVVDLVNDLLDMERLSLGRLILDSKVLDASGVLEGAYEQVAPLISRRAQHFSIHAPASPVFVCGEHKRLVQVLANLLNNAAKYTPPGGTIEVELATDTQHVTIAVTDNGVGIAPDLLPRVFDAYTQASLTTDRREGGLGLGLPLVRQLTELHGGSVRVDSRGLGLGSTFTITLPLAMISAPQDSGNI